ncbi:3-phosphoshikimate 1-carboxyvinyltransferase [Candidatus Thioglobus sp.]|jgi:3-phosphoshikimate 1-carboxyvinyltransferase|uniref:3-phosphoshikimate 1-carboxyvinyltransferase n=1 Tax=Candidatus Thioglobus sp. TaxID=2026721 RepID=UPI001D5A7DA5|nr:3-phosphoshikimate 1-carboxyvinyltransferase [Candidatus Thioglobus sp.]MBT3276748.1 3-phosphoshikimate 1-carboxyvinyltransferase [Candidatus Thioglobus sp.]MBT4000589.1 3-phosphoshikimate 1-carboxyvinyltransferase [Candidatus Thioglobus sp.]MBT4181363.1 3-phosphoshikimate 1-carboxyvinyltransferase [Candidatus Thioglobus sp.]MBT6279471.1 3-phosphoshikimate 1-carboxyvinyltransferase [Candidatus Thioglobus sp.]MBT6752618.1 3-phosphoshikimate 1-carboxyvinyltransferase [Candidatus Thioglobus sp
MSKFIASPANSLSGNLKVPGDKSISHRSIMLGSLSHGITKVSGFLEGEDALSTLKAFQAMGVKIERDGDNVTIHGVGINGLKKPQGPLDLGNSGTSIRLMSGILAAQAFDCELVGDESLSKRPMNRVINPLRDMGAIIDSNDGKPPLKITGGQTLKGIDYDLPVASAQVKSCILLAGLYADGDTCVTEPAPTRDHTERMLKGLGYKVRVNDNQMCLTGGGDLKATEIQVPSDISSSAFFMVAAAIAPKADITLLGVNINPTRTGVIDILQLMGANLTLSNEREIGGELLADIRIQSSKLTGIHIPEELVPLAIDEFPAVFIAASCATGETILTGAKELRVKESDRIQVMADGLDILGIDNEVLEDGIKIQGGVFKEPTGMIESHHDHRISMSFAVASLRCDYPIEINGVDNVMTSFPNFVELANSAGMSIIEI